MVRRSRSDQAAAHYLTYLIRALGAQRVRLVMARRSDSHRIVDGCSLSRKGVIHPDSSHGCRKTRTLSNPEKLVFRAVAWLPDSRRIVAFGHKEGQSTRGYVQDINEGAPRAFTAEGVSTVKWWSLPISPDGTRVLALSADLVPTIYRIDDGTAEPVRGLQPGELPVRWTEESQSLIVAKGGGFPWVIERLDIASGRRTPVREIRAHEAAGLRLSLFAITPDGRHYVHSYSRLLTDLFVVDGLR